MIFDSWLHCTAALHAHTPVQSTPDAFTWCDVRARIPCSPEKRSESCWMLSICGARYIVKKGPIDQLLNFARHAQQPTSRNSEVVASALHWPRDEIAKDRIKRLGTNRGTGGRRRDDETTRLFAWPHGLRVTPSSGRRERRLLTSALGTPRDGRQIRREPVP